MVERCARCDIPGEDVRLFDAVYDGRIGKICERCAIIENIPIIKRPEAAQLKESEKGVGVYDRMRRLAGLAAPKKQETYFREDRLRQLNEHPALTIPERRKLNLIDHFHWEVMKNRRRKGLTQEQLAERIGESVVAIQMIEKAQVPERAEQLIKKLEQFLQVKLTRMSDRERFLQQRQTRPMLLDKEGRELETIPEPEVRTKIEEEVLDVSSIEHDRMSRFGYEEEIDMNKPERKLTGVDLVKGELDIERANLSELKISDLKDLHRRKVEATRKEQIEEQKRIEERNRLIEARKEELRLMKERQSKDLDEVLGGEELLKEDKDNSDEDLDDFEKELK